MINRSKTNPKLEIGKMLKKIRKTKNLSQNDLSRETGLSLNVIAKIETGVNNNPTINTLVRIAKVLNIKIEQLVQN